MTAHEVLLIAGATYIVAGIVIAGSAAYHRPKVAGSWLVAFALVALLWPVLALMGADLFGGRAEAGSAAADGTRGRRVRAFFPPGEVDEVLSAYLDRDIPPDAYRAVQAAFADIKFVGRASRSRDQAVESGRRIETKDAPANETVGQIPELRASLPPVWSIAFATSFLRQLKAIDTELAAVLVGHDPPETLLAGSAAFRRKVMRTLTSIAAQPRRDAEALGDSGMWRCRMGKHDLVYHLQEPAHLTMISISRTT